MLFVVFAITLHFNVFSLKVYALIGRLDSDSLFPSLTGDYEKHNDIFMSIECLDSKHFYGAGLAIQVCFFNFKHFVFLSLLHQSKKFSTLFVMFWLLIVIFRMNSILRITQLKILLILLFNPQKC